MNEYDTYWQPSPESTLILIGLIAGAVVVHYFRQRRMRELWSGFARLVVVLGLAALTYGTAIWLAFQLKQAFDLNAVLLMLLIGGVLIGILLLTALPCIERSRFMRWLMQ